MQKASKNQGGYIKGGRMEHNGGQRSDGKRKTQRLVRAVVRTAAQDEWMTQERMEG